MTRARRLIEDFRPDLLHSHTFQANFAARMLRLTGGAPKVISTVHNVYEGGWKRTLAYRLTDRLSAHTTAVSTAAANRYIRIGAISQHKCSVVTNGIDLTEFVPAHIHCDSSQSSTAPEREFVWLAAGRVVPAKDFGNLLAAFQLVRAELPKTQLRIAGQFGKNGLLGTSGKVVELRQRDPDNVRWLGHRGDMVQTIEAADAFVLSSAWEGMPLVVGEAMAMGKPVVATDVGGVRELVGDAGFIVPPKSPLALAEAMLHVMHMPECDCRQMGRAARQRIRRYFDIDTKVDEWEALYARVLSHPR
jgi:glycosyltransferase involved in cell wall biosynthesis